MNTPLQPEQQSQSIRYQALCHWLDRLFNQQELQLSALNGDAGFRQYYRLSVHPHSYIVVDSPSDKINNTAVVEMTQAFSQAGLLVPKIYHYEPEQGFLVIADFGDTLLSQVLNNDNFKGKYQQALMLLNQVREVQSTPQWSLPEYDRTFLLTEMEIFRQWLLQTHLKLELSEQEEDLLHNCFNTLADSALAQPMVTVHRDFHCRNLISLTNGDLGVIDFQDAVTGPITYDVVSLLRDCYVKWPAEQVELLVFEYWQQLTEQPQYANIDQQQFFRWFDLMGMQRHLKAAGIFARLHHRDNKSGYLQDIPLTLSYLVDMANKYPQFSSLGHFLQHRVFPALANTSKESE
ncbi:aminoglycoside phosphotransferase family protein [Thalassotalea aquiviva]|uniref:aminoglycoside phosphotransferase family protein n=1 Tax=Thalassotalea aquiviva TaxID=3242415 RepID=UPI00352AF645